MEDALEAIIGAVFSLRGFAFTKGFVLELFFNTIKKPARP